MSHIKEQCSDEEFAEVYDDSATSDPLLVSSIILYESYNMKISEKIFKMQVDFTSG